MAKPVLVDLDFGNSAKITGLPAPTLGGDAVNKTYADGLGGGAAITVQDEGTNITTALTTLNFTGAGVTVTGGATSVVNIPGGGGGTYDVALAWAF